MSNEIGMALYRLLPTGEAWPDENEDTNLLFNISGIFIYRHSRAFGQLDRQESHRARSMEGRPALVSAFCGYHEIIGEGNHYSK